MWDVSETQVKQENIEKWMKELKSSCLLMQFSFYKNQIHCKMTSFCIKNAV